jgi:hypothetical protein
MRSITTVVGRTAAVWHFCDVVLTSLDFSLAMSPSGLPMEFLTTGWLKAPGWLYRLAIIDDRQKPQIPCRHSLNVQILAGI